MSLNQNSGRSLSILTLVVSLLILPGPWATAWSQQAADPRLSRKSDFLQHIGVQYLGLVSKNPEYEGDSRKHIAFRLYNNSRCIVSVASIEAVRDRRGNRIVRIPNQAEMAIVYLIDDEWGYGDSLLEYELLQGRSLRFSVPLNRLKETSEIAVPVISTGSGVPFSSKDAPHVYFKMSELPKKIRRKLGKKSREATAF